jgi:Helix-turn-helix domain
MSMTATRAAWGHIRSTAMSVPARLVLLALADRHNQETGRCDPSLSRIALDTQLSERAVRLGLRDLEVLKLISTTERKLRTGRGKRNLTNRYRIKGGAQYAGGMGHNMPPNHNTTPSAFDDLAMMIENVGGNDE